jgi:hypothetical protein
MLVKTVKGTNFCAETVGSTENRYRLVHRWVPEMVLNVESESFSFFFDMNDIKSFFVRIPRIMSSRSFVNPFWYKDTRICVIIHF